MQLKQYISLGQQWVNQIRQVRWMRSLLDRLMAPPITPACADYEAWRKQFLRSRLGLCLWLAFLIWLTFTIHDLYDAVFPLSDLEHIPKPIKDLWFPIDITMFCLLVLCGIGYKLPIGRQYPAALLLSLFWSITLVPQVLATLHGFALPDVLTWSLASLAQATLIPVRWELHLLSQAGLIIYFYGVNSVLGLTTVPAPPGLPRHSIYVLTLIIYLFWLCFICDLGVYLYERLQRAEFESRRQAQIFLHAVSHDLRNPVTGIALVLKSLLKKGDDRIMVSRSVLERMLDSSDRQLELINSLLEIHNSDIRKLELHQQPVALGQIVESVVSDLEPLIQDNQATLHNQVSPELPLVNIDKTQLWRVFCNLIANALHHNSPGVAITINASPEADMLHCSVQDNGIGMTQPECDRIFDLYTRGFQAKRTIGLGLGLYLCRQIILAHGGKIGVNSKRGQGATFWFTLPIAKAPDR